QAGECTARAEIGARRSDHRSPKKSCGTVGYPAGDARQRRRVMMDAVVALAPTPCLTASACAALNVSRASVYRQRVRLALPLAMRCPRPSPQRALTVVKRQPVHSLLPPPGFPDQAPAEVYASLLDEG